MEKAQSRSVGQTREVEKTRPFFEKRLSSFSRLHSCMLGRGVLIALPTRFLPRIHPDSPSKIIRKMSVGADATQPEVHANKMARVEDTLRVKKISENAILPVRGSEGAAGYDLAAAYECGTSSRARIPSHLESYAKMAPRHRLRRLLTPHARSIAKRHRLPNEPSFKRTALERGEAEHIRNRFFRDSPRRPPYLVPIKPTLQRSHPPYHPHRHSIPITPRRTRRQ